MFSGKILVVPITSAGKLVLVLGVKWERPGVNIQVVPSTAAGNHLGNGWELPIHLKVLAEDTGVALERVDALGGSLAAGEREAIPLATLRGRVGVAPVLEMLGRLPAEIWLPEGQESNVQLKRAGHDRWGVGKVVLVMCDDFTTQVFHFPWWQVWRPTGEDQSPGRVKAKGKESRKAMALSM